MVAVTPGGGIQDNGRTPTMTIKPAAWAAALFAYAGINIIAAVDSVLPSGSGQVWATGFVTAIAAGAGGLLLRYAWAYKQVTDQLGSMLEDERAAHRETRKQLAETQRRLTKIERELYEQGRRQRTVRTGPAPDLTGAADLRQSEAHPTSGWASSRLPSDGQSNETRRSADQVQQHGGKHHGADLPRC